jgi:indole-3-pyruvate monooxygenase
MGATRSDVAVIGAGPAGLATAACLRARGISADILEKGPTVGSSWRTRYERLRLHTVKRFSALPMMPFPRDYPRYVPRALLLRYLQNYAEHFDLRPRFNAPVVSVRRKEGGWEVATEHDRRKVRIVVVATGYSAVPQMPNIAGMDRFAGPILHSSAYRDAHAFSGRSVLVIGLGNSGAEIALDLSENGAEATLSVRGPAYLAPRDPFGVPIQILSILSAPLPNVARDALFRLIVALTAGDLGHYGIFYPAVGVTDWARSGRIPVLDIGTALRIRDGTINVCGAVAGFEAGRARFADGTERRFDAVICATGFRSGLPLFVQDPDLLDDRGLPRARNPAPGLYFVGFTNPLTGLLRAIAKEARQVALRIAAVHR